MMFPSISIRNISKEIKLFLELCSIRFSYYKTMKMRRYNKPILKVETPPPMK